MMAKTIQMSVKPGSPVTAPRLIFAGWETERQPQFPGQASGTSCGDAVLEPRRSRFGAGPRSLQWTGQSPFRYQVLAQEQAHPGALGAVRGALLAKDGFATTVCTAAVKGSHLPRSGAGRSRSGRFDYDGGCFRGRRTWQANQARTRHREPQAGMSGFLGTIERVGNMVPHPAIIFFMLIGIVIVLSVIFGALGTTVTYEGFDEARRRHRDADLLGPQPAVARRHPLHADLAGRELPRLHRGRRDPGRDDRRGSGRGIGPDRHAGAQAGGHRARGRSSPS